MQFLNLFVRRRSATFRYYMLQFVVRTPFPTLKSNGIVAVARSYIKQRFLSFLINHVIVVLCLILTQALRFKRPKRLIAQSCILRQTYFLIKLFKFLLTDFTKSYHTPLPIMVSSSIFVFFFKNRIHSPIPN